MTENVYDKARQVLREHGWTQKGIQDLNGRVCLIGAIGAAAQSNANCMDLDLYVAASPYRRTVEAVIREQYPDAGDLKAWDWNDYVATSVEQVDAVLDKAARAFDEQVQS